MENEIIKIFDEYKTQIGTASREEVHKKGYWHETFHCWFIGEEKGIDYIYFQIRSDIKKDFPSLLDITAAGHILANETIADGIREVKEELGIDVSLDELVSLGVIKDCIMIEDFIDRELSNVYLYRIKDPIYEYRLQKEEVSGIVKAEFNDFYDLCLGKKEEISVEGFKINEFGEEVSIKKNVNKKDFVPHQDTYLQSVVKLISENI